MAHVDEDLIDTLIERLDLAAKARLLTGADFWSTPPEPVIGLRRMVLSDGPSGVRGENFDEREPSLSLPSATALGATWDPAAARRYGAALGAEARRQHADVVLGPTINLHRTPFGGRHFEALSEDPLLTGELAAAYVSGMQAHGVAATPKHYVANDAETARFTVENRVDERALREVYLAAFEPVVVRAGAWALMSAYNAVNGPTMSENRLLTEPLTGEWGFDGLVVSDWGAVRGTEASANAEQHLAMPGPVSSWGEALVEAVRAGRVAERTVDGKVRRLLRLAARVGALDGAAPAVTAPPAAEDGTVVARELAVAGMVLLRNTAGADPAPGGGRSGTGRADTGRTATGELPWDPASLGTVAVLGHNAALARTQGGGSATVRPAAVVSPLEGLRAALGAERVRYRLGAQVADGVQPFDPATISDPVTGAPGLRAVFRDAAGAELRSEHRRSASLIWMGPEIPGGTDHVEIAVRWAAPAGSHRIGAAALGHVVVEVDGRTVLDVDAVRTGDGGPGEALFEAPSVTADVDADGPLDLLLRFRPTGRDTTMRTVAVTVGAETVVADPGEEIAAAAALAAGSDVAVVVVGTNDRIESEGFDRTTLALPGHQDELVRAVAAANPRTVVVVNAGAPVLLPWRDEVAAVLLGWFGGERFGEAVADVLLGAAEPGGRLPTTWPDTGGERSVSSGVPVDGVLHYAEGVHIGHRNWLRHGDTPAYPFGHGLGYTTWTLDDAVVTNPPGAAPRVHVTLTNTGARAGRQVVQAYLARPGSAVERPARWLAGWAVVDAEPGTATAVLTLSPDALRHRADDGWAVEPGTWTVHIGFSVTDTPLTAGLTTP
ncbi:glycoside hydrolase family 3 C-terminal domain-containing protein [Pseudonocardia sp. HH130630-07]|uniref:glycoside hydrolase family 3 C-terminal domain-containing protein n=1 Tax=Pseudonocardia sp. HH130630-07 TaxID=1690815 RepID=UPI000814E06F|nr:glycoside hydrolase family 3 C-terminal domain-containing protein [Pseudonocardia sp. HH130630-07]ANY05353.1 glycosyl hydrolase [Pseudonocardia sp. HH130630-07]